MYKYLSFVGFVTFSSVNLKYELEKVTLYVILCNFVLKINKVFVNIKFLKRFVEIFAKGFLYTYIFIIQIARVTNC